MASIEDTLSTEVLALAQVSAALELSAEAGWNQTIEDWKIFLAHGRVTGVFATNRRLVATAATLPYARFGYIAMVLVTAAFRHRGIATRLLRIAMLGESACDQRVAPIYKKYEKAAKYKDFRQMLDKEAGNIDAVIVSTPDHVHAVAAYKAMERGKHVYVEKPIANTLADGRRMIEACAKARVTLLIGHVHRRHAANRKAADLLLAKDPSQDAPPGCPKWKISNESFFQRCLAGRISCGKGNLQRRLTYVSEMEAKPGLSRPFRM